MDLLNDIIVFYFWPILVINYGSNGKKVLTEIAKMLVAEAFCVIVYIYLCDDDEQDSLVMATFVDKSLKAIDMRQIVLKVDKNRNDLIGVAQKRSWSLDNAILLLVARSKVEYINWYLNTILASQTKIEYFQTPRYSVFLSCQGKNMTEINSLRHNGLLVQASLRRCPYPLRGKTILTSYSGLRPASYEPKNEGETVKGLAIDYLNQASRVLGFKTKHIKHNNLNIVRVYYINTYYMYFQP